MTPTELPPPPGPEVRVRFLEDTSYAGVDYGPDFPEQIASVRKDWAEYFVRKGRAEYVAPRRRLKGSLQ